MPRRRWICLTLFASACSTGAGLSPTPGALGFDEPTTGWRAGSTGGKGPMATWLHRADAHAISPPNVLSVSSVEHESEQRFNLYWNDRPLFQDGIVTVAVRADHGEIDQGGGPMWRVHDEDNYYVCRLNPLEGNFNLFVVAGGVRRKLATAEAPAVAGEWHRIEVEHRGERIWCWLDGRRLIEVRDRTLAHAGGVGLWTKADARTSFDDLLVSANLIQNLRKR